MRNRSLFLRHPSLTHFERAAVTAPEHALAKGVPAKISLEVTIAFGLTRARDTLTIRQFVVSDENERLRVLMLPEGGGSWLVFVDTISAKNCLFNERQQLVAAVSTKRALHPVPFRFPLPGDRPISRSRCGVSLLMSCR